MSEEDLEKAVRGALERDEHDVEAKTLSAALALSQGSVRRALELATGEGIGLYREILDVLRPLPELDGARLHKLAERLGGFGATASGSSCSLAAARADGAADPVSRDREGRDRRGGALAAAGSPRDARRTGPRLGRRSARAKAEAPASISIAACSCSRRFSACSRRREERRVRPNRCVACRGAPPRLCHHRHGDKQPYYITTAISYPNDVPHIGHAYEADRHGRVRALPRACRA